MYQTLTLPEQPSKKVMISSGHLQTLINRLHVDLNSTALQLFLSRRSEIMCEWQSYAIQSHLRNSF